MRTALMTRAAILVITLLGAGVLVPVPQAAAGRCASEVYLETLHIEAKPSKKKLNRGERFTVKITATRPAHRDPLDQGIEFEPPVSLPAAEIPVGITIFVGDYTWFWGAGITDENGEAVVDVQVTKNSELGWGMGVATGRKYQTQVCPEIVEEGSTTYLDFVKVVR